MEVTGAGKSPNTTLSFRYNANNEVLEELFQPCEDDPPTPQSEPPPKEPISASPKRGDKTSIIDKYFKSIRTEKSNDKQEESKVENKLQDDSRNTLLPKDVTSSPMKDYLNRLGKRSTSESVPEAREGSNETWKIFHDFKFKIAQAVEDMKTRSAEENKERSLPRESSTSDSEENSAIKDTDQQSVGDTDNQVSSLESSIQNLSEMIQPLTAKASEHDLSLSVNKNQCDSSVDTHRNIAHNDLTDVPRDDSIEIESGVEALEDTIDGFGDVTQLTTETPENKPTEVTITPSAVTPMDFNFPPSKNSLNNTKKSSKQKATLFNLAMYFLTILLILTFILFPNSNIWLGFLLGLWVFCFASNLKAWILDNYFCEWDPKSSYFQLKHSNEAHVMYTIPSVKEHRPLKKYEGWINHYRSPEYDPYTYHISKTNTAFMKLEGCNLRISYTTTKIAKRALWDEKIENVAFYQHRLYNLTGAQIILLPMGLVRRRQWSKKYPICIILNEKEKIQVLEKEMTPIEKKILETVEKKGKEQLILPHESESAETNTSPEKKKKFIWRRREKSSNAPSESEPGKEGLRHRLVRKIHRDKRSDSVSSTTEPEVQAQSDKSPQSEDLPTPEPDADLASKSATSTKDDNDDEIDDSELSRIKEVLDEAELDSNVEGAAEGEWSLHVKHSKDKHSHLFLFARTGRDKHEWYRRLNSAINEASASSEASSVEDKPSTEHTLETKDGIELSLHKMSEKDTISLAKNKMNDTGSEGANNSTMYPQPSKLFSYEKTFWPYLFKIIQSHQNRHKHTTEIGVMCQIESSPHDRAKCKKKKKGAPQNLLAECECRTLPAEVTWVNTVVARLMFDVMRDPATIARLQSRIQRKLNTLKLPSFMSPLAVTELSLAGACPLVRGVSAPACDERGVWLDADIRYDGGAHIAILTQINLMKLKEKNITLEDHLMTSSENTEGSEIRSTRSLGIEKQLRKRKPAVYDSEIEDSAESSSDDENPLVHPIDSPGNFTPTEIPSTINESGSSKKKFLRMVDRIATNKYFQQVTDYKYVKRAMEGLSNTDIKLQLEVHGLEGRLAINLPAPPHDRIWIGFRTNPQLVLRARPAVGARALRFAHISNWIEQKLTREFEKVLVLPNMEDIVIDLMTPTPVQFE